MIAQSKALLRELGEAAYGLLRGEADEEADWLTASAAQRVLVVAERAAP